MLDFNKVAPFDEKESEIMANNSASEVIIARELTPRYTIEGQVVMLPVDEECGLSPRNLIFEEPLNSPRREPVVLTIPSEAVITPPELDNYNIQNDYLDLFPGDARIKVSETTAYVMKPIADPLCTDIFGIRAILQPFVYLYSSFKYFFEYESLDQESILFRYLITLLVYVLAIMFYVWMDDYNECLAQVHDDQINYCNDHEIVGVGVPLGFFYLLSINFAISSKFYQLLSKQTYRSYFKDYFHTLQITNPNIYHVIHCYNPGYLSDRVTTHIDKRPFLYEECKDRTTMPTSTFNRNLFKVESRVVWTISNTQLLHRFQDEKSSFYYEHVHCNNYREATTECELEGMDQERICCMNPDDLPLGVEYGFYIYIFLSLFCLNWIYVMWFMKQCEKVKVTFTKNIVR